MALVPIPSSILDRLGKLIFSFLWGSTHQHKKFHLVDWHLLARPCILGGWGIKHLHCFSLSLRMKNFWYALNSTGIWYHLISSKYMRNMPLHSWLRKKKFCYGATSPIWKGFLKTLPWIGRGILWQVGCGSEIIIGVDPVAGMHSSFTLPAEMREYLADYGISTLDQARNHTSIADGYWFTAEELDLCAEWKSLCNSYINGLEFNRIRLKDSPDSLIWSHSNFVGQISAAKGYECIFVDFVAGVHSPVIDSLWKVNIPLKLVCFCWLLVNGKILTWDHLQRRKIVGPSWCSLYKDNEESTNHLFVEIEPKC